MALTCAAQPEVLAHLKDLTAALDAALPDGRKKIDARAKGTKAMF